MLEFTCVSSVNSLPVEVLTEIFIIVSQKDRCYCDGLAQVCSYWRFIAINCPYLWSHIHCSPYEFNTFDLQFYSRSRAELRVARSGTLPLEIHIMASLNHGEEDVCLNQETKTFLRSIASRIEALHIDIEDVLMFYQEVASGVISNSTPRHITELITDYPGCDTFIPIDDHTGRDYIDSLKLPIHRLELDKIFDSIAILDISGLYPQWTNTAYRGLVDLRIVDLRMPPRSHERRSLSELQLITILKASPELRILHFGYPIIGRLQSPFRVALNHLEVLRIIPDSPELGTHGVLRLIAPGSKPLRLTIQRSYYGQQVIDSRHIADTESFLTRARVEIFHVSKYSLPEKFFQESSHLKILILENHCMLKPLLPGGRHSEPPISPPTIEYCYLLECSLELSRFYSMVRQCSVQRIVSFRCHFYFNRQQVAQEIVQQELARICPVVEFTYDRPTLTTD